MFHDDLYLLGNIGVVQLNIFRDLSLRGGRLQLWVVLNGFVELKIGLVGHIVLQHIQNKALLNGLLHRIQIKGGLLPLLIQAAEQLQGGGLGGRGKGDHGDIGLFPAAGNLSLHDIAHGSLLPVLIRGGSSALPPAL